MMSILGGDKSVTILWWRWQTSTFKTRNSAIPDKPRDAFTQMQCRDWQKTRPSPCVLPCQIWSFCVKTCRHKYRRTL